MEAIYLKIKSVRLSRSLTQEDMAKALKMTQSNYARMERGLSQISVDRLIEIASIFEMTPEALLSYTELPDDFKEDAQFYYNQVVKLEQQAKKRKEEDVEREQQDSDYYRKLTKEKEELGKTIKNLKKEISEKDNLLKERAAVISRLETDVEYHRNMAAKLLELFPSTQRP